MKIYGRVEDALMPPKDASQYVELNGVVYCYAHFNEKYPTMWNYMIVNHPVLAETFAAKFCYWATTDEITHCDICKVQFRVPNNTLPDWTQAWVEVSLRIGYEIGAKLWVDEKELRHQCYIILGRHNIKANDHKKYVRILIERAKDLDLKRQRTPLEN